MILQAAFADININKNWSVYYWLGIGATEGGQLTLIYSKERKWGGNNVHCIT